MSQDGRSARPPAAPSPGPAGMRVGPWIGRALAAMTEACSRHPLVTVLVAVAVAAAAMAYTLHTITFVTSSLRLLPQHERYVVRLKEYQRDFGELNDILVVVEAPSTDVSKAYAARLVRELEQAGVSPSRVTYRIDPAYFDQRGLLYLPIDELVVLRDRLFDYQEFIESYAAHPTLPRLLEGLNQQIANAMALGFFDLGLGGGGQTDLRFLESTIDQISARLDGKSTYTSPWTTAFSVGRLDDPDAGYFFSSDRHWLFLFVRQTRQDGNFAESRGTIDAIRRTIARLGPEFPGVQAGVTGGPAISNDEMVTAFDDSKVATLLAFGFTLVLLIGAFRRVVKPMLMLATLVVSLAWSMGIITLVIGHLSIFSVMFISIVVGIGIDYGIYLLYRYREELGGGSSPAEALRRTAERAGPGMLLGALTATGAFFVLMLTDFQGIREFGFVAGTAISMAFLSMVTLFPALLALVDGRAAAASPAPPAAGEAVARAIWLERITEYRKTIMALTVAVTAFTVWSAVRVGFDYNMLKLQAKGVESVVWEERILAKAGRSGFAALATSSSLDELRRKQEAFAAVPTVAKVESILMLVPDRQLEKVKLIQQFAPLVAPVHVGTATVARAGHAARAPRDAAAPPAARHRGGKRQGPQRGPAHPGQAERPPRHARPGRIPAGRARARAAPGADRPRLRRQAHELPEELDPTAGRAGRCSPRAPASLCREERALPAPHPPGRRHLAAGGSRALRDGSPAGGPRRHRPADHELRGHSLHPARLLPGHPVRAPARDRRDRGDSPAAPSAPRSRWPRSSWGSCGRSASCTSSA